MKRLNIDYRWQNDAACKGMSMENYDLFYVSTGKSAAKETNNICLTCLVKEECLNYALQYEEYGFWANTTAVRRNQLRKELNIELVNIDQEFILNSYEEELASVEE